MDLNIFDFNGLSMAELVSDKIELSSVDDALDLIGNSGYLGADAVILYEKNISRNFFDLRTKLAGEILQKFSDYRIRLAIVGEFSKLNSRSLNEFIYESNKARHVVFAADLDEAKRLLTAS